MHGWRDVGSSSAETADIERLGVAITDPLLLGALAEGDDNTVTIALTPLAAAACGAEPDTIDVDYLEVHVTYSSTGT